MVGGLVHQKSSTVVLVPVPAAEVVRAVLSIEQPLKMDRVHGADGVVGDQFPDFRIVRGVAVVERYTKMTASALYCVEDLLTPLLINSHGFLADDIAAKLHSSDNIDVVGAVDGCDDNNVRFGFGNHAVEVFGFVGRDCLATERNNFLVGDIHAGLVGVAEGYELGGCFEVPHNG